jgi:hypothetical protein
MIKQVTKDTIGLLCLLAICLMPLGLFADDAGWGWHWPNVGGFYIEQGEPK